MNKSIPRLFFDSCAFYPPQTIEKEALKQLKQWEKEGKVQIEFSYKTEEEVSKAPGKIPQERFLRIYTLPTSKSVEEKRTTNAIRQVVFPDKTKLTNAERNDILHLFEAQKYGHKFFVTVDFKHILSKADKLRERFGIKVVSPSECVEKLRQIGIL